MMNISPRVGVLNRETCREIIDLRDCVSAGKKSRAVWTPYMMRVDNPNLSSEHSTFANIFK